MIKFQKTKYENTAWTEENLKLWKCMCMGLDANYSRSETCYRGILTEKIAMCIYKSCWNMDNFRTHRMIEIGKELI